MDLSTLHSDYTVHEVDSSCGFKNEGGSALFQHDFCGLNHRGHRISNLELHFLGAALRNDALDHVLAHADHHMRHHAAEFDFDDFALKPISRR